MSKTGKPGIYRRFRYQMNATLLGVVITAVLLLALTFTTTWSFYFTWVLSLSVTTFILFGLDKSLAVANQKRVPEIVLHLFTLMGGFVGQAVGRAVFRHKISREKRVVFNVMLLLAVALHAGIIYLLYFAK
ncbi:MAG: DUF1294 domain-containing protein [Chloroflexi bacterium]|nr:DUF1294 domain-containing protein [Chloroflexota bacterium]MBK8931266.1 DUF1294 domain-containing protein [Chloroflexota bacterium]MBP6802765.1 DUF1294 domain-containing protein [Chloroflexota bacterium]